MVLPAASAQTLSATAIINTNNADLQLEVSLAENKITAATAHGAYQVLYNAQVIGNPAIDPRLFTNDLPINQKDFYNAFIGAGYIVGLDANTGFWSITWAPSGPETMVIVYSFRTTLNPSSPNIVPQTMAAIEAYFNTLTPVVHVYTSYDGFINETGFGGTTSTFYEFTIIAGQYTDRTDHSANVAGFLYTQGLGYNSGNANCYFMTP
jgi:hypothetical protein